MAAFLTPPALPVGRTHTITDFSYSTSPPRRRSTTFLSMLADKPMEKAPASLDELIRNWFVSTTGGKAGGRAARERTELMSSAVSGPLTGPDDVHFILSTTIIVKPDAVPTMSKLLKDLSEHAEMNSGESGVLQCAVNQSPEDPAYFIVVERFDSRTSMTKHQKSAAYQQFIREAQPILEKPFGLHLCKERSGQLSPGYYPFGPSGEGGRDDMILR
jgi:quinol monooxygenase YgiN